MKDNAISWGRFLVEAVESYAQKHNIAFELFSGDWIMRLEKDGIVRYLFGNDFGVNTTATSNICNDKSATYQILTREGIPALEHRLLLRPESLGAPSRGTLEIAQEAFAEFNNKIVYKPNKGGGGTNIFFIDTESALESTLTQLFIEHRAATISPQVTIDAEYRVCVLNNTIELVYEKMRQGDALQHNLSLGAIAKDVSDEALRAQLTALALTTAQALNGNFLHVDIISVGGELLVLEVNSGIMFEHYALQSEENRVKATEIYHKSLDTLFV